MKTDRVNRFLIAALSVSLHNPAALIAAERSISDGDEIYAALVPGPHTLKGPVAAVNGRSLDADEYEVLNLQDQRITSRSNARVAVRGCLSYLEIPAGSQWTSKIRGAKEEVNYATFTVSGSIGTVVNLAGAVIRVSQSTRDPIYATLEAAVEGPHGTEWHALNHDIGLLPHGRQSMAPLNVVTIKIDHTTARWTIWVRDLMLANNYSLLMSKPIEERRFTVTAGSQGAWVSRVAFSDVNPLFEDTNNNSVPDDFELKHLGQLLRDGAAAEVKAALINAWREERSTRPASEFILLAPQPDELPEWCRPSGVPIHGMPNTLIIRSGAQN